jgi:putative acetyltransferase
MLIRREAPADVAVIRSVTAAAFARDDSDHRDDRDDRRQPPGPDGPPAEAPLVDWLRASPAWIPPLSLVALAADGDVIGHVVCTRGHVADVPVLALGPLSVRPDRQRSGVGSALMHAVLGAADALGEPLVVLLGWPDYYPRFGFRLASEYGITPAVPAWVPHFQVRTLTAFQPGTRGPFAYPEPFDRL